MATTDPNAYPNDPATQSGVRADPLYLGPTNFANIQKQYTPYQIEQATRRDAQGNIFWKQGVNIADIPRDATQVPFKAPTAPAVPAASTLPATPTVSEANVTKPASPMDAFAQAQSQTASTYLTGIKGSIDTLLAQQQQMQTAAKQRAEQEVSGLKNRLLSVVTGANQAQDAVAQARAMFKVEESINTLTMIQGKIAAAADALNQGLIYEESRPVRMALLTGRSAELKKQGIATIGALQASAEVVRGNIELARAYAADSIAAIKQDNAEKMGALNTLLDLANGSLIRLSDDEKETIDRRMSLLDAESQRLDAQKDQLLDLAIKYPNAFASGSVTFTDSPEQALQKMIPTMSAQEKQLFDLDVQAKKATIAKTNRAGTGTGGGADSNLVQNVANDVTLLKGAINPLTNRPYTDQEIRAEILKEYGGDKKTTDLVISATDQALQGTAPRNPTQLIQDAQAEATQKALDNNELAYQFDAKEGKMVLKPVEKPKPGLIERAWGLWDYVTGKKQSSPEDQFTTTK